MNLSIQTVPFSLISDLAETTPKQQDPLISRGGEETIYVGLFLLVVALTIVIGKLSPKIEHALFFALFASMALISFIVSR